MLRALLPGLGLGLPALVSASLASASLVINEFLADPAGADAGGEFVELLNTGPEAVDLQGVSLDFANGSVGPLWEARWRETGTRILEAGAYFLIVDRNWTTTDAFDAQVSLALQNGPDAIRLARDGHVLDMVGYGNLTDPMMMEEQAVPLPTGQSLGRRPDGHDSDNNAADFRAVEITPGWRNFPDHALELVSAVWDPPCAAREGQDLRLDLEVRNTGLLDLPGSVLELAWVSAQGVSEEALSTAFGGCGAGERWTGRLNCWAPPAGRHDVRLTIRATTGTPALNLDLGGLQVGPGALVLTEVLHLPPSGLGEWVEFQAREDLNTHGLSWRDEDGGWRSLPPVNLEAGERLLVAQDSTSLEAWAAELQRLQIPVECGGRDPFSHLQAAVSGWPNLNNSPPEGRDFAERILLADSTLVILDQVVLPSDGEGGLERGFSWELSGLPGAGGIWRACLAPAGSTPGCANSVVSVGIQDTGALTVSPAVLDRATASPLTHILFRIPAAAVSWHVEVYDLWGERVRDMGGGQVSGATGDLLWDGRRDDGQDVPAGGYIVVLLLGQGPGGLQPTQRALVVVR